MTKSSSRLSLNFFDKKILDLTFSDMSLSSDGGIILARQVEEKVKICQDMADFLTDNRDQTKVKHSLSQLISQRIYQIIAGYEDSNDSNKLRQDPIFKLVCNQVPTVGENLLASQPTMSRLENQVTQKDIKQIRRLFVDKFLESYPRESKEIVLDIDAWDALTHGHQQLSLFNGYHRHDIYFPVLINEASSGYPLVLQLRAGNSHSGKGVAGILKWLFLRIKRALPEIRIVLRGDGGFSLPEIIEVCEKSGVGYVFGFSNNDVLKRKINYLLDRARLEYCRTGEKVRLFDDVYYAARSWSEPRRVIMKAEWLEKGPNPRFIITSLETEAQDLYDKFYVQRGATSEHRIKELKLGIKSDRLSCEKFIVNQFRLFLSQAAYILMLGIRQAAQGTKLAKAQVPRLRETIIKIAAKVTVSARRVLVELPYHCPFSSEINLIVERLASEFEIIFS